MKLPRDRFIEALSSITETVKTELRRELRDDINAAIDQHRRAIWLRNEWCCNDMVKFAKEVWFLSGPPVREPDAFGGTMLTLRGRHVNYCPFCGVKV